jgi:hypothetical protein
MSGNPSVASLSSDLRDFGRSLANCLACYATVY